MTLWSPDELKYSRLGETLLRLTPPLHGLTRGFCERPDAADLEEGKRSTRKKLEKIRKKARRTPYCASLRYTDESEQWPPLAESRLRLEPRRFRAPTLMIRSFPGEGDH
jgi:hypothetical protein